MSILWAKQQVQQLQREQFGVKGKTSGELCSGSYPRKDDGSERDFWLGPDLMGGVDSWVTGY